MQFEAERKKDVSSMKPVEVTIGLCVRNSAETLPEAIMSIAHQDFSHDSMELIFLDDGSQDKTLSIIQASVLRIDIPAKVFRSSWRGLGHARNMVVANASADLILWVDGDMVLPSNYVRSLVEFMKQHPEVGVAKGKQSLSPGGNLLATLESCSRAAGRMVDYRSDKGRYRALGTGGAIYRTAAIVQVGGFDENLRGYGEDWDAEIRIRDAGWVLDTVDATFSDYERYKITWKSLWRRYWLRGYYTHYFLHKNRGLIKHHRMFPPAASLSGLLSSFVIYRLTRQKAVFLLALESTFKMTAWYAGFLRSHFNSYAPRL